MAEATHLLELREHSSELLAVREAVRMTEIFFFPRAINHFGSKKL